MKRCGLYIRVSTDRQAKVEEGSLKNQDHLLTQHAEFKNKMNGEQWVIVERYIDEGKSAKDTKGRPAYLRMVEDVRRGRIDTVLCTALSRISRSTRDLLDMIEFFKAHDVDFICLKEDFDTTTAQGKCFVTIMGALNEFEREQVGERTRTSILARASRGLWNGGQVLGYDPDPQRKGHLLINPEEAKVVNFLYDTYLELGSVYETAARANRFGYRTKAYTGRRGLVHPPKPFAYTSVLWLLASHTYIGKKEINKCRRGADPEKMPEGLRYKLVDAVWPALVDTEKFNRVQELLRLNHQHGRNGVKDTRHFDALQALGTMVAETEACAFNREAIQQLLASFEELFQKDVQPYQRKVLLKWALERIELSPKQLKVGLQVRPAAHAISPPVGDHPTGLEPAVSQGSLLIFPETCPTWMRITKGSLLEAHSHLS